ncbi:hypothetical protein [Mucilaginibacter sp.]|nr:hypothetical protein [Mucilaginibacter sp.]
MAEANGNKKTILLSLPSHLCDGPIKELVPALAQKSPLWVNDPFGTVNF